MKLLSTKILSLAFIILPFWLAAEEVKIRIIVANDIHATVFAHDFMQDEVHSGSLARIKTYVDAERAKLSQSVVLLDNGDLIQGQPTGYFANFVDDGEEHLFSRMYNMLAFDAASVGNHDIEAGPEVYNRLVKEFNFPWLAANAVDAHSGQPHFQPYAIIEREGIRLAVLGLTPPSIPNWLPQKLWEGIDFVDLYESARYWVEYIRNNENPDAIIGLFHAGAGRLGEYDDYEPFTDNAGRHIARFVPGIDVVLTAHDHQQYHESIENIRGDEVLLIGGRPYGYSVAVADLIFDGGLTERRKLKRTEGHLVDISAFEPCLVFNSVFMPDFEKVMAYVNAPVGRLENELVSRHSYFGNASFTDFVHEVQLSLTGADISFAAPLSYDVTIPAGQLNMRDMFNLYRYENYLYVMALSGAEVQNFLEYSYSLWLNTMSGKDDHLLLLQKNEDGNTQIRNGRARFEHAFFNFDSADGISYTVDVSKEAGQRVQINGMKDGSAFDPAKTYKVALNSYRGSGGGGHLTEGAGIEHAQLHKRISFVSDKDLRSHMADYIRAKASISPQAGSNWQIIPAAWVEQATKRDYKLLFE